MFDWLVVEELDGSAAADALVAASQAIREAEAFQFALAAHWADLHDGEELVALRQGQQPLPGQQRVVPIRGGRRGCVDGCPEVTEYAGAELAALSGLTTVAGEQLMSDAVAVRHRHPLMWSRVRAGEAPAWLAAKVAQRCIRAGLDAAQAEWVDSETTEYVVTLPPGRFLDLVDAKIKEADPEAAEERARAKALARFVHAGRVDEDGLRTLVARASAGDITYVVAVLDRIAQVLADQGDYRPLEVLRTEALRILANPARALALLTEATLEVVDPNSETAALDVLDDPSSPESQESLGQEALWPHGTAGIRLDATGAPLPASVRHLEQLPLLDADQLAALPELEGLTGAVLGGGEGPAVEEAADPALLRSLLEALRSFDATKLDPVTVLHVHLSEDALTSRTGVARVEGIGPVVLAEVRDWLSHTFHAEVIRHEIQVRPVLDASTVVAVDRYERPAAQRELTTCRTPYESFPFGTLLSRKADDDHPVPYVKDGPPGQTSLENHAKLSRFHHRLKTDGNWVLRQPEPGVYWWRTPHGHWYLVDLDGTHWHGCDPALDRRWLTENQQAA